MMEATGQHKSVPLTIQHPEPCTTGAAARDATPREVSLESVRILDDGVA